MFEYSNATPGAFENGMPARAIADRNASLRASWRSPHGLSSGKPSECVRRCRSVISGESFVAFGIPASSGTHFATASSRESLPSSRSLRIASAVKLFVMDAIRKTVSASTAPPAVSRTPQPFAKTSSPSTTRPTAAPGSFCFSTASATAFSTAGRAARSFARRAGSANAAGGTSAEAARGGAPAKTRSGEGDSQAAARRTDMRAPLFTFKENLLFSFPRMRAARSAGLRGRSARTSP